MAEVARNNVRIVVEPIVDSMGECRFYPMVGPARHHRCHYKCTVYFEKVIRSDWPVPYTAHRPDSGSGVHRPRSPDSLCRSGNGRLIDLGRRVCSTANNEFENQRGPAAICSRAAFCTFRVRLAAAVARTARIKPFRDFPGKVEDMDPARTTAGGRAVACACRLASCVFWPLPSLQSGAGRRRPRRLPAGGRVLQQRAVEAGGRKLPVVSESESRSTRRRKTPGSITG